MDYEAKYNELLEAARNVRTAQKKYFNPATRTTEVLTESKRCEKQLDSLLWPEDKSQISLF